MAKNNRIQDLHFYVVTPSHNNEIISAPVDLFDLCNIRLYAAKYRVALDSDEPFVGVPLFYIFGEVWSRSEFEFEMSSLLGEKSTKVDLYRLYVAPNEAMLLNMVKNCTATSARSYIRAERARLTK